MLNYLVVAWAERNVKCGAADKGGGGAGEAGAGVGAGVGAPYE